MKPRSGACSCAQGRSAASPSGLEPSDRPIGAPAKARARGAADLARNVSGDGPGDLAGCPLEDLALRFNLRWIALGLERMKRPQRQDRRADGNVDDDADGRRGQIDSHSDG